MVFWWLHLANADFSYQTNLTDEEGVRNGQTAHSRANNEAERVSSGVILHTRRPELA